MACNKLHKNLVDTDIHVPHAWEYADATTREAASGFVSSDVGKLAKQLDTNGLWMLTATTPTWQDITTAGGAYHVGNEVYEIVIVTIPNQVSFTLSYIPVGAGKVRMYPQGGLENFNTIDYNVSSNVVSYIASSPSFSVGEKILFKYFK